jgi:signal peptidase II
VHYVFNSGLAFSFLSDYVKTASWRYSFIIVNILTVSAFLITLYYTKPTQKLIHISYSMIIGGALGNLFDRVIHGYVIDMIDVHIRSWHFATFNIADSSIFIGVLSTIISILLGF